LGPPLASSHGGSYVGVRRDGRAKGGYGETFSLTVATAFHGRTYQVKGGNVSPKGANIDAKYLAMFQ